MIRSLREGAHLVLPRGVQRRLSRVRNRIRQQRDWTISVHVGPAPPIAGVAGSSWHVLSRHDVVDAEAGFVADPFAIRVDSTWFLFFEVLNRRSGKGEIALATSDDLHRWEYKGIVLSDEYHLSYPHVFEWQGDIFMTPECWEAGAVLLYKACQWPANWELVARLVEGPVLIDPSPFFASDHWWMFAESDRAHRYGTLRLYEAAQLTGPWVEHPASPIVVMDPSISRPAGRIISMAGVLLRVSQDCSGTYGAASLDVFEIETIDRHTYQERRFGSVDLASLGVAPAMAAVHHIDMHDVAGEGWVSFFDLSPL